MNRILFIQVLLTIFIVMPAFSQKDTIDSTSIVVDTLRHDIGLFDKDEILNISLAFDITQYKKKKMKEEYLTAVLTYHINNTDSIKKEIKLKTRGQMRKGICDYPPILLNFKKNDFKNTELSKIDKIKMVTHCERGNEDYLFKEYLIYKLYNVLTDYSFKVRLVKIEYINTAKESKPVKTHAFLVEPIDMLAERTHSLPLNVAKLSQKSVSPEIMDRMAIFSYMIGNTDWSVPIQHNCKFLSSLNLNMAGLAIIVPFDFDYAGLVDTDYAVPFEGLGLASVRDRRYLGICRSEAVFMNAIKEFTDKKEEFFRIINEFPLLKENEKKVMIRYLESFYSRIDKNKTLLYDMQNGCINF
jgi:hypothetical protein